MFFSTACFLAAMLLPTVIADNSFLVVGFAGLQIAGQDGCAGQVVQAYTGTANNANYGECESSDQAATCMTFHNIQGNYPGCEVRYYSEKGCVGDYHWIAASMGSFTTANTVGDAHSVQVFCFDQ